MADLNEQRQSQFLERRELLLTPSTRMQYVKVLGTTRWLLAFDGVTIAYLDPLPGYEPEQLPDSSEFDGTGVGRRREGEAK